MDSKEIISKNNDEKTSNKIEQNSEKKINEDKNLASSGISLKQTVYSSQASLEEKSEKCLNESIPNQLDSQQNILLFYPEKMQNNPININNNSSIQNKGYIFTPHNQYNQKNNLGNINNNSNIINNTLELNKKNDSNNLQNVNNVIKNTLEINKTEDLSNINNINNINNFLENLNISNDVPLFIPKNKKEEKNIEQKSSISSPNSQKTFTKKAILIAFNDQNSTKVLQSWIRNEASKQMINDVVNELSGTYPYIIKNKNGNYFITDLCVVCDHTQRIKILKELSKTIGDDCTDKFASHPIQTFIDYSSSEEEYNLILSSFNNYNKTLLASIDPNGSYVIQKIIQHIPEKFRYIFNLTFISFIHFICNKKFGVVNAKKFVDCTKSDEIIDKMVDLIRANFLEIATNQFGNFFIQHLLEKWNNTRQGNMIKERIISNYRILFVNKYAKHIFEFFLKIANIQEKNLLIKSIQINLNNTNNNENEIDSNIMIKIFQSLGKNLGYNQNNNKFANQNQNLNQINSQNLSQFPLSLNNYNNNNSNNYIDPNQFPLSLNNFNKRNNNKKNK